MWAIGADHCTGDGFAGRNGFTGDTTAGCGAFAGDPAEGADTGVVVEEVYEEGGGCAKD